MFAIEGQHYETTAAASPLVHHASCTTRQLANSQPGYMYGKVTGDLKYAKVYHHIQVQTRLPYTEVNSLAHNISCTVLHELNNKKNLCSCTENMYTRKG